MVNARISRSGKTIFVSLFLVLVIIYSIFSKHSTLLPDYSTIKDDLPTMPNLNLGMFDTYTDHTFISSGSDTHPEPKSAKAAEFWISFSQMLSKADPAMVEETLKSKDTAGWLSFESIRKGDKQPDLLKLSESTIAGLAALHEKVVDTIEQLASNLPYVRGTRGIVTTAGPTAEAILTTSLRMVRKSGSTLPIEIWYYDETEYDEYLCEKVWAPMNARCMLMSDYLPAEVLSGGDHYMEITHHFQMKILTLMFSTFEHALFLDCDLFPVNNPDSIMVSEPFISSGWVLWPDYWANTNSPDYYKIVSRDPVDQYARQSTESGAMLVNKATHNKAMLLSAYYNRYGVEHFYWLLSQGAIGHGDKDTYMPAINHFNLTVYQLQTGPRRIGYRCNGNERPIASGQAHPYDDWLITSKGIDAAHPGMLQDYPKPRVLFVHGNLPKNDAVSLMDWFIPVDWDDQLRCDHGEGPVHRQWGPKEFTVLNYGYDAEKSMWDQMRWLACQHEAGVKRWKEGIVGLCTEHRIATHWCKEERLGEVIEFQKPRPNVCRDFTKLYDELFPNEIYDGSLPGSGAKEMPWSSIAGA